MDVTVIDNEGVARVTPIYLSEKQSSTDAIAKHISDKDHYAILSMSENELRQLLSNGQLPQLFIDNTLCSVRCFELNTENVWKCSKTLLTSQYSRPHVDLMSDWKTIGCTEFHPGDHDGVELLRFLHRDLSAWIYWGHAEPNYLRGYGHLHVSHLQTIQRTLPLELTIWLTCNTLCALRENQCPIGLYWYLSQNTKALLASAQPVNTEVNEAFSNALLCAYNTKGISDIRTLLLESIRKLDKTERNHILHAYRMLGSGQIKIEP